jgi:two-component system response regulator FixJ
VVDDDAALTRSLKRLLETSRFHVTTYETPSAFLDAARCVSSGCVLLDLEISGMDGLEFLARLLERNADLPVIAVIGQGNMQSAVTAMKTGAVDFIEKPPTGETLLHAIEAALVRVKNTDARHDTADSATRVARLSPREREVLVALVLGKANKVIASDLGISIRTVEVHRARMMERLGVRRFAEAIRLAVLARIESSPNGR